MWSSGEACKAYRVIGDLLVEPLIILIYAGYMAFFE